MGCGASAPAAVADHPSARSSARGSARGGAREAAANLPDSKASISKFDVAQNAQLKEAFRTFSMADKDGSGKLDSKEFSKHFGLHNDIYLQRLMVLFDGDGNGQIDFTEFIMGMSEFVDLKGSLQQLKLAFRLLDLDGDGYITKDELMVAIRVGEERWRETSEHQSKKKDGFWGDREPQDVMAVYTPLLESLARRPPPVHIVFDEFVGLVDRYPRIAAPANFIWNRLSKFAKPAYDTVQAMRQNGDRTFLRPARKAQSGLNNRSMVRTNSGRKLNYFATGVQSQIAVNRMQNAATAAASAGKQGRDFLRKSSNEMLRRVGSSNDRDVWADEDAVEYNADFSPMRRDSSGSNHDSSHHNHHRASAGHRGAGPGGGRPSNGHGGGHGHGPAGRKGGSGRKLDNGRGAGGDRGMGMPGMGMGGGIDPFMQAPGTEDDDSNMADIYNQMMTCPSHKYEVRRENRFKSTAIASIAVSRTSNGILDALKAAQTRGLVGGDVDPGTGVGLTATGAAIQPGSAIVPTVASIRTAQAESSMMGGMMQGGGMMPQGGGGAGMVGMPNQPGGAFLGSLGSINKGSFRQGPAGPMVVQGICPVCTKSGGAVPLGCPGKHFCCHGCHWGLNMCPICRTEVLK